MLPAYINVYNHFLTTKDATRTLALKTMASHAARPAVAVSSTHFAPTPAPASAVRTLRRTWTAPAANLAHPIFAMASVAQVIARRAGAVRLLR
jgi:hypothetical protein